MADATAIANGSEGAVGSRYGIIGGFRLRRLLDLVPVAARSELSVLVTGESGVGKELVAKAIHEESARSGRFRAINCAAISPQLFESEMFGYKKGAFTGAERDHAGLLRAAHGGSVFLDEIGDMPAAMQAKLLRVLETREVLPVGAVHAEPVDLRVISATHQNLPQLVTEGKFRGDLFARLNGFPIRLPALRHRREDIALLVRHFEAGCGVQRSTGEAAMAMLVEYDWPYNVRELGSVVQRALAVAAGSEVGPDHLPEALLDALVHQSGNRTGPVAPPPSSRSTGLAPASVRPSPRKHRPIASELLAALIQHRGNVAALSRTLGKDRAQVHRWLRDAGIDVDAHRD